MSYVRKCLGGLRGLGKGGLLGIGGGGLGSVKSPVDEGQGP